MKASIAYSGVKENGKRRRLADKVACASFDNVKDFTKRKEGVIASVYRTDEIELRVLNGDGANWITANNEADAYQLDPFHRNKAIREYVDDPELRKTMTNLLYAKDVDLLLAVIEASINSTMEPEELSAPVIKCKKAPVKKCRFAAKRNAICYTRICLRSGRRKGCQNGRSKLDGYPK